MDVSAAQADPPHEACIEALVWGAEKSSRIQPRRVELEPGDEPWHIDSAPWWLRCRLQGSSLQVAVRNCGRHRGAICLSRGDGRETRTIQVQSDARPTLGGGTRGAAMLIAFGLLGATAAGYLYGLVLIPLMMSGGLGTNDLMGSMVMGGLLGGVAGAIAGLGFGGLPLVGRSACGALGGAAAAGLLFGAAVIPALRGNVRFGSAAYDAALLFLVPLMVWVPIGTVWGAAVGGRWLAARGAAAGLAAVLLALPIGILVSLPFATGAGGFRSPTGYAAWWGGVWLAGPLLFAGLLGALLAPCRLPK
jgi:hypothetical protein